MLRGIIISPDRELADQRDDLIAQVGTVAITRTVDRYPNAIDLQRTLRAHAPQVIFLSLAAVEFAIATAQAAEAASPGIQIITINHTTNPQALLELMRVGIREFLGAPFKADELLGAIGRITENLQRNPITSFESDYIYSFLPAKPGVGASTIAMNVAAAASKRGGCKTVLVDLDLNSGMQRFMMKLDNEFCITDAVENSFKMDEALWPQLVTAIGDLDVLHSGRLNPGHRIEPSQMRHLVEFMRRFYRLIAIDLSGNMERYSIEIMEESRRIFLVTTAEISSLHLARERYNYLKTLDLGDRIELVLNRNHKRAAIDTKQIEDLLGLPVKIALPNDYQGVSRALTAGKPVDPNSDLGREFKKMAYSLVEMEPSQEASKTKQKQSALSGILSILPGKGSLFSEKKSTA
jgi:pilus assembly protein CpaE